MATNWTNRINFLFSYIVFIYSFHKSIYIYIFIYKEGDREMDGVEKKIIKKLAVNSLILSTGRVADPV